MGLLPQSNVNTGLLKQEPKVLPSLNIPKLQTGIGGMGGTTTQAIPDATTPSTIGTIKNIANTTKDVFTGRDDTTGGIIRNTITGLPRAGVTVIKGLLSGLKDQFTNPSDEQKAYEEQMLPYATTPVTKVLTAPGVAAARVITRFINPMLQPVANDIADIIAVREKGGIADQVAEGKIPASYLDEIAVLHKTAPQIVGDVTQAVLAAYSGGKASGLLKSKGIIPSLIEGFKTGLPIGEMFGGAQALSSGTNSPMEALSMIGQGGLVGGVLGSLTAGAGPISKGLFDKVKEAKTLYDNLTPAEKQAGKVKNPFAKDEGPILNARKQQIDALAKNIDDAIYNLENADLNKSITTAPQDIEILKSYQKLSNKEWNNMSFEQVQELSETMRRAGIKAEQLTGETIPKIIPSQKIEVPQERVLSTKVTENKLPTTPKIEEQIKPILGKEEISPKPIVTKSSLPESISDKIDIDKYIKEQVAKRESARISENPTWMSKTKSFLANAKTKLVDFTAPIEDVLNATVKKEKIKLAPSEDIHNQIDRVLRSPTLAGQFAKDNGIVKVIRSVENLDALDQYLIAKHAIELDTRGITTGRDMVKDTTLVKKLAPKYEEYAKVVSNYSQKLLDYSVSTGLISKDLAEMLKKRYPDYVPFQRIFNEVERTGGQTNAGGVASISKQTVVQAIEGSSRQIESPIRSLLEKTNDAFKQGEKNAAARLLANYEKLPGNPFGLKEITGEEVGNRSTISFIDNGVKRTFETLPEIAQAAKSLNVQQLNILGKIFALPVRIARVGITGINPAFVAANVAKDAVSAFINSNHGLKTSLANPANFVKSLFSAVSHDKLYNEMVRAGGAGTSYDIARNQVAQTVERIRSGKNVGSKIMYTVKHPSEILRAVEDIIARSEEFTRIQQYRGTKEALLKKGMSNENATVAAARQARDATVNFARRGEWGQVLNSAFLYLNASIQGTRTLLTNLKNKPVQTTTKIVVSAMFPIAVATAWNLSDPERKKAYDDIAEYEKQNNLIIIPPNPVKDEKTGKWNVIKIPLSQEINGLVGLVRRPIESAYGSDPLKFTDFSNAIIGTVSPVQPTMGSILSTFTPQIIKPTIEAVTNKSLFTGFSQVPYGLQKLSPENQVKETTSGTARQIGSVLGVSPIKVEEFIKGTFGGVSSLAINAIDKVLAKSGVIPNDQIGGQEILDTISARFNLAAGGATDDKAINDISNLLMQQADTSNALKIQAEVLDKELAKLSPDEAAKRFEEISKTNPKLAAKVIDVASERKMNLTYEEKLIKQLGVTNGERAKYIDQQIKKLPVKDRPAFYDNLIKKKLVTEQVSAQIQMLNQKK